VTRVVEQADQVVAGPVRRLAACLDLPDDLVGGEMLPPLWHWLFFLESPAAAVLGRDGHRADGGLIGHDPALPVRMWAGGQVRFCQPVKLGAVLRRESHVAEVRERDGRSGRLRFVSVRHRIAGEAGLLIEETQNIVLREAGVRPAPGRDAAAVPEGAVLRRLVPNEVMLFRFSALTFNAHRIHYDAPYATEVEHYPGLVVHGPLQAVLLAGHAGACVPGGRMIRFDFRAESPAFCGRALLLACWPDAGRPGVWQAQSRDADGVICMTAEAEFEIFTEAGT